MEIDILTWIVLGIASAGAFALGWSGRRVLANGQATELKRALYDSKGAIPQLEAAVRTRDQRIGNYQTEAEQLRNRISALETSLTQKDHELVKRDRDLRRVNSELSIAKEGGLTDSVHPEMQMIDGASAESPPTTDAVTDTRLKQAEARYEALKRGLITRDDRITELEARIGKSPSRALETEIDALRLAHQSSVEALAERDETIKVLQARAQEDAEQRVQFETLAKRRTETNRELKDKLFKFESQLPKLMETLKSRNGVIAERDASIATLKSELKHMTGERDARDRKITGLEGNIAERDARLATQANDLQVGKQHNALLQQELDTTVASLKTAQATIRERDAALATQAQKLIAAAEAAESAEREKDSSAESFKSAVRDREFRIDALTNDVEQLTATVSQLKAELAATSPVVAAQQELHQAALREKQQAMESLKGVVRDREFRIAALTADVERLTASQQAAAVVAPTTPIAPAPDTLRVVDDTASLRIAELETQCGLLKEQLQHVQRAAPVGAPAPSDSHAIKALEGQLADARRRSERAEDELLESMQQVKALRERIEELESPPEAQAGSG